MKWWRIFDMFYTTIDYLHPYRDRNRSRMDAIIQIFNPCHEDWADVHLLPPANDNGWWMGS